MPNLPHRRGPEAKLEENFCYTMYKRLYVVVDMLDHDFKSVDSRNGRPGRRDLGDARPPSGARSADLRHAFVSTLSGTPGKGRLCKAYCVRVTICTDGTNGQVL
jgi:hypothetical protein